MAGKFINIRDTMLAIDDWTRNGYAVGEKHKYYGDHFGEKNTCRMEDFVVEDK
jgi:hypothetical protein